MAVPQKERPMAHDIVDDLVAVHVPLAAALGSFDVQGKGRHKADVMSYPTGEHLESPLIDLGRAGVQAAIRL
jgi:hypothetical protein